MIKQFVYNTPIETKRPTGRENKMGQITLDHIIDAADCKACRFTESGAVIVSFSDGKVYTGTCTDYIGDWRVPEYLRHAELSAIPEEGETVEEAAFAICEEYIHPILAITSREGISDRSEFWGCAA